MSLASLTQDENTGKRIGKYEILCRLSHGGMSEIFLASQRGLAGFRKLVVVKRILPNIKGEEEFVRMFLDEARVTAAFTHPNIAQTYDLDIDNGQLFLALEFVPGATLLEVAKAMRVFGEKVPIGFTLRVVRDTALALHYAHTFTDPLGRSQCVIHRDIAEKNIMVTYDGTVKLLDFGVSKAERRMSQTAVSAVKGSFGYMSPEQLTHGALDARSDVFALGIVLHQCLTGVRLFYAENLHDELMAPLKKEALPPSRRNPDVSTELDAVVLKALEKNPDHRYASALEFARAVERVGGGLLWETESCAQLITRLFDERRRQSQEIFANSDSSGLTGERFVGWLFEAQAKAAATSVEPVPSHASRAVTPGPVSVEPLLGDASPSGGPVPPMRADVSPETPSPGVPAPEFSTSPFVEAVPWEEGADRPGATWRLQTPPASPVPTYGHPPTVELSSSLVDPVPSPDFSAQAADVADAPGPSARREPDTQVSAAPPELQNGASGLHTVLYDTQGALGENNGATGQRTVVYDTHGALQDSRTIEADTQVYEAPPVDFAASSDVHTIVYPAGAPDAASQDPRTLVVDASAQAPAAASTKDAVTQASPVVRASLQRERTPLPSKLPVTARPAFLALKHRPFLAGFAAALVLVLIFIVVVTTDAFSSAGRALAVAFGLEDPIVRLAKTESPSASVAMAPETARPTSVPSSKARGRLTLRTEPPAKVRWKGSELGSTPLVELPFPVGNQQLELIGPDNRTRRLNIQINDGELSAFNLPLTTLPTR